MHSFVCSSPYFVLSAFGCLEGVWSAQIRIIFQLYRLPDPLSLLDSTPGPKKRWKSHTSIAVLSHHERLWRQKAADNQKLQFLNVQCTGLTGKLHPILSWVLTTQDVVLVRPHVRMLAGHYSPMTEALTLTAAYVKLFLVT